MDRLDGVETIFIGLAETCGVEGDLFAETAAGWNPDQSLRVGGVVSVRQRSDTVCEGTPFHGDIRFCPRQTFLAAN